MLLEKYCCFTGRASRSEYWWFVLFTSLISVAIIPLQRVFPTVYNVLAYVFGLGLMLPQLGVVWRRLHDIGKSGWWYVGLTIAELLLCIPLLIIIIGLITQGSGPGTGLGVVALICSLLIVAIGILLIVWYCQPSQKGPNRYGEEPYMESYEANAENNETND